jgi:hypothetical protein
LHSRSSEITNYHPILRMESKITEKSIKHEISVTDRIFHHQSLWCSWLR